MEQSLEAQRNTQWKEIQIEIKINHNYYWRSNKNEGKTPICLNLRCANKM